MKKISLFLIFVFSLFIGIVSVGAMSLGPVVDSRTGVRGENLTVYILLYRSSDEKPVSAVDGKFIYDENVLTLVSADSMMGSSWTQLSGVSNNGIFSYANLMFNDLITDNSKNIVKIVFRVNNNAKYGNTDIRISNPSATDESGNAVSVSAMFNTIRILSDDNDLSNLTVGEEDINFDSNTTNYDLTIDNTSVDIGAVVKDGGSKLSGDIGSKSLKYGLNTFKITVTSESGKNKVYTLNITRPDNRSSVNTLSSLKLSSGNIKFKSDVLKYDVDVENNISSIKLDASLTDDKSTFVSGYGSRSEVLKEGKNTILIKVKAENESVKTYTLNVTRKSNKSSNNYLSEIKLSSGNIDFDRDKTDYSVNVNYDVKEIDIDVKTEDSKSTYEILNNNELSVGENTITIKVKAEDESVREYKIVVTRKEENQKLSSNSKLSSLTIENYYLQFDSSVYEYSLEIKDESSLDINYIVADLSSKVDITGNSDLKDGSVINILVTAEDGSESLYKINIVKSNNSWLIIIIVILIILLLIGLVLFIIFKKNRSNDVNNNQNNIDNNYDSSVALRNEFLDSNINNGIYNSQGINNNLSNNNFNNGIYNNQGINNNLSNNNFNNNFNNSNVVYGNNISSNVNNGGNIVSTNMYNNQNINSIVQDGNINNNQNNNM